MFRIVVSTYSHILIASVITRLLSKPEFHFLQFTVPAGISNISYVLNILRFPFICFFIKIRHLILFNAQAILLHSPGSNVTRAKSRSTLTGLSTLLPSHPI